MFPLFCFDYRNDNHHCSRTWSLKVNDESVQFIVEYIVDLTRNFWENEFSAKHYFFLKLGN